MHLRVREIQKSRGWSQAVLEERSGIDQGTLSKIEKGKANPTLDRLAQLAQGLEVSIAALFEAPHAQPIEVEGIGSVTQIPRYDIQLSAGHGAMNFEGERKEIPIPFAPDFLDKKLKRSSQEGLTIVEAAGDSMEPTIADGDLIMVDMCDQVKRAGIFGYEMGGETYVKRLEWTDYGLTILSDNPLYPMRAHAPDKLEEERFKLIGRVVWVGRVF